MPEECTSPWKMKMMLLIIVVAAIWPKASNAGVPVLDTTGHKVVIGGLYEIREVININGKDVIGGGLVDVIERPYPNCTSTPGDPFEPCCVGIVGKVANESLLGVTVAISQNKALNLSPIIVSTDINITGDVPFYHIPGSCGGGHQWGFKYDEKSRQYLVMSGKDCCGTPPAFHGRSWFRVVKSGKHYGILGCYRLCMSCKAVCNGIGYKIIRGHKLLTFSDVPSKFVFRRELENRT